MKDHEEREQACPAFLNNCVELILCDIMDKIGGGAPIPLPGQIPPSNTDITVET